MLIEDHIVRQLILNIKKEHARMGTRKIYHLIKPEMKNFNIKIAIEALYD